MDEASRPTHGSNGSDAIPKQWKNPDLKISLEGISLFCSLQNFQKFLCRSLKGGSRREEVRRFGRYKPSTLEIGQLENGRNHTIRRRRRGHPVASLQNSRLAGGIPGIETAGAWNPRHEISLLEQIATTSQIRPWDAHPAKVILERSLI